MKKIKFFALAIMAMLSINAFAAEDWKTHSNGTFTYKYDANAATPVATITGFRSELPAADQATVTIPTQVYKQDNTTLIDVTIIGADAFKGNKNIKAVTIPDTKVGEIEDGAFAGCTSLTTVTIGKKVLKIGKSFNGCTSLSTVTFNAPAATDFQTIKAGAFEETAIVTLDLTTANVKILNPLFEALNTTLTTVKLPATLTNISDGAFKQLAALATIDWTACAADITIGDGAAGVFDGAPQIKELVLPAKVIAIAKDALKGSNIQKLTITSGTTAGKPTIAATGETKLKTLIVTGDFLGVIGTGAFSSLTSATFEGTVATGALIAGSFSKCANLATVTFQGELKYAAGSYAVAAEAFNDGTGNYAGKALATAAGATLPVLTISYEPASTVTTTGIAPTAFSSDGSEGVYAQLATTTAYYTTLTDAAGLNWSAAGAAPNYSLKLVADPAPTKTTNLKMESNGSGKYYYAKLLSGSDYKIAAKQGDATVVVYGAYADTDDAATIYMENLKIIKGFYWVPKNTPVIVKSTSETAVVLTASDASQNSTMKTSGGAVSSEIKRVSDLTGSTANTTGLAIKDLAAAATKVPYFIAPIKDYGFKWSKFKDERIIYGDVAANLFAVAEGAEAGETKADFLIYCNPVVSADRIKVVWLDGSEEEATAIQTVKENVKKNGAIFNLAGQKVNASYKGVVIKDGKKYIQK